MSWKTLFRLITKKLSISIQPTIVSSNRSGHGNSLSVNCNHRWKNVIISTNINSSVNVNGKGNCNRNANGKFNYNDNTNDNRNHNSNGNGNGNVNRNHNGNGRGYGNRNINENDNRGIHGKQDSVGIPQIPLGLHTSGHMERPAITCTLVVYTYTLTLIPKELTR